MNELTIVIPAYKSENLIERTLVSILDEGIPAKNIIVIEDGVYDNTAIILQKYGIIHKVHSINQGAPIARNNGLSLVKTDYVMFIDSDDFVSNKLLSGLLQTAKNNITSDIVFGPWRLDGEKIPQGKLHIPPTLSANEWIFYWLNLGIIPTCSVLWKTSSIRKIGAWCEYLKKNQDGELMIRAFTKGLNISISQQGFSTYWQHNSENRISKASLDERYKSSSQVYHLVKNWITSTQNFVFLKQLGAFCCKEAWIFLGDKKLDEGQEWLARAIECGYKEKGFTLSTKIIGNILGVNLGAKVKKSISPLFKKITKQY